MLNPVVIRLLISVIDGVGARIRVAAILCYATGIHRILAGGVDSCIGLCGRPR